MAAGHGGVVGRLRGIARRGREDTERSRTALASGHGEREPSRRLAAGLGWAVLQHGCVFFRLCSPSRGWGASEERRRAGTRDSQQQQHVAAALWQDSDAEGLY